MQAGVVQGSRRELAHAPPEVRRVIGAQRVDFVAVPTRDRERAARFYGETLGFGRNPNSSDTWIEFETGNLTLALVQPETIGVDFAPLPFGSIAIRVPDVAAAKQRLGEAGVEFRGEIWDSGVCHGAVFSDPDGNGLLLHHRYAPYRDGTTP
ncbi:MAG: VOC family protein [Thermoleophilia bacterium]|nr:VOC family protein [Thermoleophilia bacterium]